MNKSEEVNIIPPIWMASSHVETIIPALFRKVDFTSPREVRISTPDFDFIDADYYEQNSKNLVIICHGLEGNSRRPYMLGMAKAMFQGGMDVCCWNYRGCSGVMNKQQIFYHSGATYDLETVVEYNLNAGKYNNIYLIGFSLGGNVVLNYLGRNGNNSERIKKAIAISVPIDLHEGSAKISDVKNKLYEYRFLKGLKRKIREKSKLMSMPVESLEKVKTLRDFDELITAPLHGFKSADDYYTKCSSRNCISEIKVPSMIINARNDTFLTPGCFPETNPQVKNIRWCITNRGGHVGFTTNLGYFSEKVSLEFFQHPN